MEKEIKYKYEIHPIPKQMFARKKIEQILNERGKNGWKFITCISQKTLFSHIELLIFEAEI
ncbi:DUF4177 domain-containing protein [Patescibacteria group bacterium]|nr:DUF4177 domain-containing protein [Patescibacteria group bacterium]MBU3923034.1 DUF4177 domain-containing protein [Patescibacteria group bacterium]